MFEALSGASGEGSEFVYSEECIVVKFPLNAFAFDASKTMKMSEMSMLNVGRERDVEMSSQRLLPFSGGLPSLSVRRVNAPIVFFLLPVTLIRKRRNPYNTSLS